MLVNTSFNVRGEPIVCTPREAFDCFHATEMDVLVLEDFVLDKSTASERLDPEARHAYLARFQPDRTSIRALRARLESTHAAQ
jgi:carbamoyltransferase